MRYYIYCPALGEEAYTTAKEPLKECAQQLVQHTLQGKTREELHAILQEGTNFIVIFHPCDNKGELIEGPTIHINVKVRVNLQFTTEIR